MKDSWGEILPLPLTCCVTLDKLLNFFILQFTYLLNKGDNSTYLVGLL